MTKKQTYKEARMNTPAKKVIKRVEAWLDAEKNREIRIAWRWSQVNRYDRMGVIIASENGEDLVSKCYSNGDMRLPNPDFRRTNSNGHRQFALEAMMDELEARDRRLAVMDELKITSSFDASAYDAIMVAELGLNDENV